MKIIKSLPVLLFMLSLFSFGQQNPTIDDLRQNTDFHHVYDSLNPRAIPYLMIATEYPGDVAAKVGIIRQHQYGLEAFFKDFVSALALKYSVDEETFYSLFESYDYNELIEKDLSRRISWTDELLLSYLHFHAGRDAYQSELLAIHSFKKSNSRITALLILEIKRSYGITSPCQLYSFYLLYENHEYSDNTTWLSYDEEKNFPRFYTVYKDHCDSAPFPLGPRKDWLEYHGSDNSLFYNDIPPTKTTGSKTKSELEIGEIEEPYYNSEISGSVIIIHVTNKGTVTSGECVLRMVSGITETAAACWLEKIPALKPGEELSIMLKIPNHWVYGPNADLEFTIDCFNQVDETNEENNKKAFQAQG